MGKLQVATTILEQLGGNKFIAMTGAKNLSGDEDGLNFKIGRNNSKANVVRINYNYGKDLYQVRFLKWDSKTCQMVELKVYEDVYCDMLQSIFTEYTGLFTSL